MSCHGLENLIVTSDYRTIEKTVIHRIISVKYEKTRDIPRIFLFDSCEGSAERVNSMGLIRPPTIDVNEFEISNFEPETEKNMTIHVDDLDKGDVSLPSPSNIEMDKSEPKALKLKDIENCERQHPWTKRTKNPDYNLATIHGANAGFVCKFNSVNGSYLTFEFSQRFQNNLHLARGKRKNLEIIFVWIYRMIYMIEVNNKLFFH